MTSLSVIIPFYNKWNLVHQSLYDLHQHCRNSLTEVLLVNDASDDGIVYDGIKWWKDSGMLPIRELRLKENHRFLRASNKGMKKATGEILCLLSNDVRVYSDFAGKAKEHLMANPKDEVGGRVISFDSGWNVFDGRLFPYVEGWLICIKAELWDEIGGFDEQFAPNDYEDMDLSTEVLKRGGNIYALDASLNHIGAQSIPYGSDREKITRINQEKFRQKWIG